MAKNTSKLGKVLIWITFAVIPLAIVYIVNHKVFQVPYTSAHTGKEYLEFPLSKVTVPMKKDVMMQIFAENVKEKKGSKEKGVKVCDWAYAKKNSNGLMLCPRKGKEDKFLEYVNENGQAEKIARLYHNWSGQEHGFAWGKGESGYQLFIPEYNDNDVVLVPTWILYVLVEQNIL